MLNLINIHTNLGVGRYSVKCEVVGDDTTQINEGFIISRYTCLKLFKKTYNDM